MSLTTFTVLLIMIGSACVSCVASHKLLYRHLASIPALLGWWSGIILSVIAAALFRGPGSGGGEQGESVLSSLLVVDYGLFAGLLGSALGVSVAKLTSPRFPPEIGNTSTAYLDSYVEHVKKLFDLTTSLKVISVIAFYAFAPLAWFRTIQLDYEAIIWARNWIDLAAYLFAYSICLAGSAITPFLRCAWKRIVLSLIIILGYFADQISLLITGHHITAELLVLAYEERELTLGFIQTYRWQFGYATLTTLPLFVFFVITPRRVAVSGWYSLISLAGFALCAAYLAIGKEDDHFLPPSHFVPTRLLTDPVMQLSTHLKNAPVRAQISYSGQIDAPFKKVVVVIDEAIRGDSISINNVFLDSTPFLKINSDMTANFGVGISSGNCSRQSRARLRLGITEKQVPYEKQIWENLPTVWQYAAQAGMKTVLIDTHSRAGNLHSYMNNREFGQIDKFISILSRPYHTRDIKAAEALIQELKGDERKLIYVNKYGAHQPYSDNYGPETRYYPNKVARDSLFPAQKLSDLIQYQIAINQSVDGFFRKILPVLQEDTVLVYTSDHGQSLYEGGYAQSHCSLNPIPQESFVPVLVASRSVDKLAEYKSAADMYRDKTTHFQLFSTLLQLMGYSKDWAHARYGPSLLSSPPLQRSFFVGGIERAPIRSVDVPAGAGVSRTSMTGHVTVQ